jgi:hypothetical protein
MLLRPINSALSFSFFLFFFFFFFGLNISKSFKIYRFILYIELSKQVNLVYSVACRHNILRDCKI